MLNRSLAILAAIAVGLCAVGILLGAAPVSLKITAVLIALLAATRTGDALVIVAALAPLGGALAALSGSPRSWSIPLVLALLFGAAVGRAVRPGASRDWPAFGAATAWIGLVVASLLTQLWTALQLSPVRSLFVRQFVHWLTHEFPMTAIGAYGQVEPAVLAAGGAALFALTATLCRSDTRVAATVTSAVLLSVAAVGLLNVNRLIEIALRYPPFLTSLSEFHHRLRISAMFADVNAAGALFLLVLPAAFGALADRRRRWLGIVTIPPLVAGLWLAGSRSALVLLPISLSLLIILRARGTWPVPGRRWIAPALLGSLVVVCALVIAFYPRTRAHTTAADAIEIRGDLVTTTVRMVRAHPLQGIGIGSYYRSSPRFMPERLRHHYRAQNAHNQFLQVLGELGIAGFGAFAALLIVGYGPALQRLRRTPPDALFVGLAIGVGSFLLVSLGMHPLLIPEVAIPFYIALGLTRAAGRGALAARADDTKLTRALPVGS